MNDYTGSNATRPTYATVWESYRKLGYTPLAITPGDKKPAKFSWKDITGWSEQQFVEAETLVSGIEYATLMTTGDSSPLEIRIAGALNSILMIYNVPEELRKQKIEKALSMDYRTQGRYVLDKFTEFVEQTNEHTFEELLSGS